MGIRCNECSEQDQTSGTTQTHSTPLGHAVWFHNDFHGSPTTTESGLPTTIDNSDSLTTIGESDCPTIIDDSGSVHSEHLLEDESVSAYIEELVRAEAFAFPFTCEVDGEIPGTLAASLENGHSDIIKKVTYPVFQSHRVAKLSNGS